MKAGSVRSGLIVLISQDIHVVYMGCSIRRSIVNDVAEGAIYSREHDGTGSGIMIIRRRILWLLLCAQIFWPLKPGLEMLGKYNACALLSPVMAGFSSLINVVCYELSGSIGLYRETPSVPLSREQDDPFPAKQGSSSQNSLIFTPLSLDLLKNISTARAVYLSRAYSMAGGTAVQSSAARYLVAGLLMFLLGYRTGLLRRFRRLIRGEPADVDGMQYVAVGRNLYFANGGIKVFSIKTATNLQVRVPVWTNK